MHIKSIYADNVPPFHKLDQDIIDACRKYSTIELRIILGQEQYYATPEQIERGLTDVSEEVREVWAERMDWTPTPAQIERGLTDEMLWVRLVWSERTDFTPTPEQVERGLTDETAKVRVAWAERKDFTPTTEQVERGLTDEERVVRKLWLDKAKELASALLNDEIEDFDDSSIL
ncbi:hypothetical protein HAP94_10020 [Acidithiobacillus ferrivorans]|nr:hypothetical protein [Acidithiobacillus ferrivorans]